MTNEQYSVLLDSIMIGDLNQHTLLNKIKDNATSLITINNMYEEMKKISEMEKQLIKLKERQEELNNAILLLKHVNINSYGKELILKAHNDTNVNYEQFVRSCENLINTFKHKWLLN